MYAEIMPLHSSLGNKSETPCQKEKKEGKIVANMMINLYPKYTRSSYNSIIKRHPNLKMGKDGAPWLML